MSIVPVPSKGFFTVLCDADDCGERIECVDAEDLPKPWRLVEPPGWCGGFQACSDACEAAIMKQKRKAP